MAATGLLTGNLPRFRRLLACLLCLLPGIAACSASQSDFKVAIDIGHSQNFPGALSARGVREYQFNLRLSRELLDAIRQAGYRASFLINANGDLDGNDGLRARTALANRRRADLLISIHHDSVQPGLLRNWTHAATPLRYNDEIQGYSIIFSAAGKQPDRSLDFARLLGDNLLHNQLIPTDYHAMNIPGERRDLVDRKRGIYDIEFWVVAQSEMPAVLFEAGMIVNRSEERNLNSREFRARIIKSFVESIRAFEWQTAK